MGHTRYPCPTTSKRTITVGSAPSATVSFQNAPHPTVLNLTAFPTRFRNDPTEPARVAAHRHGHVHRKAAHQLQAVCQWAAR